MGCRIVLREKEIDVVVPMAELGKLFPKDKPESYEWKLDAKGRLMIAALTEAGWVAFWAKHHNGGSVRIFTMNASRSFYSRNGRYFLKKLEELCIKYKGSLLIRTTEPDTGGGSLTIIYQGEMLHGVFSNKFGSPYGFKSIWKYEYNPEKDIEKEIKYKVVNYT